MLSTPPVLTSGVCFLKKISHIWFFKASDLALPISNFGLSARTCFKPVQRPKVQYFTCSFSIFTICDHLFSWADRIQKAAAEKSCDVHHGREQGPCFCHLTRKQNQKGAVAELKLGRDRNSGGFRISSEVERKKSCFMGFADEQSLYLLYHVEFLSPNNHILSMFWSSPVLHGWRRISAILDVCLRLCTLLCNGEK